MRQRGIISIHGLAIKSLITCCVLLIAGTTAFAAYSAFTYGAKPLYAPNEVLVTLRQGADSAIVDSVAAELSASIVRRPQFSTSYVLQVSGTSTSTSTPASRVMAGKANLLKKYQGVQSVDYNYYHYISATPNDEYFSAVVSPTTQNVTGGQWYLQPTPYNGKTYNHIYAQEGWDLQKGTEKVVVAVIDTGVRDRTMRSDTGKLLRVIHPDLEGRVLPGYDFADIGQADEANPGPAPSEVVSGGEATHGTHVAGTICAQANNLYGIAGVCWDNVWILPLKVATDRDLSMSTAAIVDAVRACSQWRMTDPLNPGAQPRRVGVINLSLGSAVSSEALEAAIRDAVLSGIVVVAASGNEWDMGPYAPGYPAAFEDVICVGASEYSDLITFFSNRGRAMDITAPGWRILSTTFSKGSARVDDEPGSDPSQAPPTVGGWPDKYGNGFEFMDGTSMASPQVAAAAALLLSHKVPPGDVRALLCRYATPIGLGRPNDTYGWGMLNLNSSLRAASIETTIANPARGSLVRTATPRFRIDFRRARLDSIRVWIDPIDNNADGIPDNQPTIGGPSPEIVDWQKYYYTLDEAYGKTYLQFPYPVQTNRAINGLHKVYVTAESDVSFASPPPVPVVDTDQITFRVDPQQLGGGWRLFSIPAHFDTPVRPEDILGSAGVLARWNYASTTYGDYAFYSLDRSRTDDEATFTPVSAYANSTVHPSGQTAATPPAGLGYWLFLPTGANVTLPDGVGLPTQDTPYTMSLNYGWNMVGNPFAFPVDWSGVVVEYAGMRATAEEAVQAGWISNAVYRYDTTFRRYNFKTMDQAVLVPWEAEWVKVKVRTPEVGTSTLAAWSDEFNDGVLDMSAPEPAWFVGSTSGTASEAGGMLRMLGVPDESAYVYATDKDYAIYTDFTVDTKVYMANAGSTLSAAASAEVLFRTNAAGTTGYKVSFSPYDSTISLKRADTDAVIGGSVVTFPMASDTVLYTSIMAVGTHLKVRVGTLAGLADVADWDLSDTAFTGPGCFRLVNDGMLDLRWDYFRFRPTGTRPADVKIIVPANPYTGTIQ